MFENFLYSAFVSKSFLDYSFIIFFSGSVFFKIVSASWIIFSVSGSIDLLFVIFEESPSLKVAINDPFDTLSPTLTFMLEILPSKGDGTSTLDLSLSKVRTGSFFLIWSPSFIKIYIISTFLKSPMSGTFISIICRKIYTAFNFIKQ